MAKIEREITMREAASNGGKKAMAMLTPAQRTQKARDAANAKWAKRRQQQLELKSSAA